MNEIMVWFNELSDNDKIYFLSGVHNINKLDIVGMCRKEDIAEMLPSLRMLISKAIGDNNFIEWDRSTINLIPSYVEEFDGGTILVHGILDHGFCVKKSYEMLMSFSHISHGNVLINFMTDQFNDSHIHELMRLMNIFKTERFHFCELDGLNY